MSILDIFMRRKCIVCAHRIYSDSELDPSRCADDPAKLLACAFNFNYKASDYKCPRCKGLICLKCSVAGDDVVCQKCGCVFFPSMKGY